MKMKFEQYVRVVAKTEPCIDGVNNIAEYIAFCARVSNPSNQMNVLTAPKLLKYCADHGHWSVFEMANITMEIRTTRDIGRQILRHRSFSFQEFSQRYADPTTNGLVLREARLQDKKNRQNSIETSDESLQKDWRLVQQEVAEHAQEAYEWAISAGVAKEQARAVLPEGLTPSTLYMNGTIRSWIHYCMERTKPGVQAEHREIANMAWNEICNISPFFREAFPSIGV